MKNHWCTTHPMEYEVNDQTYQSGLMLYRVRWSEMTNACPVTRTSSRSMIALSLGTWRCWPLMMTLVTTVPLLVPLHIFSRSVSYLKNYSWQLVVYKWLSIMIVLHHTDLLTERDVIPGPTACAHCGRLFESMTTQQGSALTLMQPENATPSGQTAWHLSNWWFGRMLRASFGSKAMATRKGVYLTSGPEQYETENEMKKEKPISGPEHQGLRDVKVVRASDWNPIL